MSNTTTFRAPDIHCGGCANAIQRALNAREGVESVAVDVAGKAVTVRYAEGKVTPGDIRAALGRAGFPASDASESASGGANCHAS
ncbi:MAG TPA: heavy-metal-associated domain-containing protein [Armatimonadaceae bacterium]|nr:heavy-metal-associated domain-containing protein [Armatimonadaceae bacterium]